jgi:hypothetical protein
VLPALSRRPERVQALALRAAGRTRVFLANITDEVHAVRVEGVAGTARLCPLGAGDGGHECGFELTLQPHAIARLDVVEAP